MKLQYNKDTFLLDGKPFRILSGAIHYFRIPQAYWEDRLRKLRACGFNTVETYCCWNLHEKQEGSFDFSGMLDVRRFLETAQRVGLYAIVRPGPFICAEIDNGGLPYWLNRYPMRLRCSDPLFLEKTRTYFARLFEELRPMLAEQGGNILALQIENEYGSYGNDADYLRALAKMYRENGAECLFFTSDGPTDFMLTSGTLPEYPATCNFGSRGARAWETLQAQHPGQPTFYRGSFTIQDEPCDTFVRLDGFTRGCVFINGFHLGRYWNEQSPQKTRYLPAPFLRRGENSLIVLELEKTDREWITLTDHPDLG